MRFHSGRRGEGFAERLTNNKRRNNRLVHRFETAPVQGAALAEARDEAEGSTSGTFLYLMKWMNEVVEAARPKW